MHGSREVNLSNLTQAYQTTLVEDHIPISVEGTLSQAYQRTAAEDHVPVSIEGTTCYEDGSTDL